MRPAMRQGHQMNGLEAKTGTRGLRSFRGMDALPASRDARYDEPCTVAGGGRRTKWQYRPTLDNDEHRDVFVSELWARLKGQHA